MSLAGRILNCNKPISSQIILDDLKVLTQDVSRLNKDAEVLVFGSFAKNQAKYGSDLDIAIVLPESIDIKEFRKKFYLTRSRLSIPADILFKSKSIYSADSLNSDVEIEILKTGINAQEFLKNGQ